MKKRIKKKVEYEKWECKILVWEIGLVEDKEWWKNKQEKYKMERIKYLKRKLKGKRIGISRRKNGKVQQENEKELDIEKDLERQKEKEKILKNRIKRWRRIRKRTRKY